MGVPRSLDPDNAHMRRQENPQFRTTKPRSRIPPSLVRCPLPQARPCNGSPLQPPSSRSSTNIWPAAEAWRRAGRRRSANCQRAKPSSEQDLSANPWLGRLSHRMDNPAIAPVRVYAHWMACPISPLTSGTIDNFSTYPQPASSPTNVIAIARSDVEILYHGIAPVLIPSVPDETVLTFTFPESSPASRKVREDAQQTSQPRHRDLSSMSHP